MPSPVHQLSIGSAFNSLSQKEGLYAHHMSRYVCIKELLVLKLIAFDAKVQPGMEHESSYDKSLQNLLEYMTFFWRSIGISKEIGITFLSSAELLKQRPNLSLITRQPSFPMSETIMCVCSLHYSASIAILIILSGIRRSEICSCSWIKLIREGGREVYQTEATL